MNLFQTKLQKKKRKKRQKRGEKKRSRRTFELGPDQEGIVRRAGIG